MPQQAQASVTARRMLLGARLRRLREERGISRAEAGYTIRASESKMSRLELGKVSFKERDVADLLVFYGVTDPNERDAILNLLREANRLPWWRQYEDVLPDWLHDYVGLEQAAERIRIYETHFVAGLLQTDDYTRAVVSAGLPRRSAAEVDRAVAFRAQRKQIVHRPDAPAMWVVLEELALRRPIGDEQVLRDQLEHLLKLGMLPHVTIQVLPMNRVAHALGGGAFTMLRFTEPDLPDVVYVENMLSAQYIDKAEQVSGYTEVMDQICVTALTPPETTKFLTDMLDER